LNVSEKAEVENLFLDCIDETKKEVLRKKTLFNLQNTSKGSLNLSAIDSKG
jgi:hypothetical protein